MHYKKRINNNVIIAIDDDGNEQILTGRGIGFQMQTGEVVEEHKVEKVFTLKDSISNMRLLELCKTIPVDYIALADDIYAYAKQHVNNTINESVIVSLCDHIYMAIERKSQDIEVNNVMLWDIQRFYKDEFKVGEYAVQLINERFLVQLSEDEAGFIALHLVNGQLNIATKSATNITKVIQEIETIVRMTFSISLDVDSVYYHRFITHVKFFAERLFSETSYQSQDVENMLHLVQLKYHEEYECVKKVAIFLKGKYAYTLSEEEVLYLCIHISRIVQVSK